MKKRIMSILLCFCMMFFLFNHIGVIRVSAEGTDENGLVLNKGVSAPDKNGVYTLTLEAYATGAKVIQTITKDKPTDIVLVLDQSGSMDENFTNSSREYNPVYELDQNYIYYVESSYGSYDTVKWCNVCQAWTNGCWTYGSYHNKGTEYVPKESAEDATEGRIQFLKRVNIAAVTKLNALKTAVTNFTNAVYAKAKGYDGLLGTKDDVEHHIAVVGFSSGMKYKQTNYNYNNTELFVGSNQYRYNGGSANSASASNSAQSYYGSAFQNMNEETGYNNVLASKNALDADGGTITNLGLEMANGIFGANAIDSSERNRVVIVFTDGVPGWSGYDSNVADAAITQASISKNTYGAKVYTIGIFSGADASSAGNQSGTETQKANWFMQNLSSNNGVVPIAPNPSYYLSANNAEGLNNIFQQISDQISAGGSSVELDQNTVVKDIVSDYFELPVGVTTDSIKVFTSDYTGVNTFGTREEFDAAQVSISDKTIAVSNFSFKDNWVGTETNDGVVSYHGKKLIIEIPIVVRDGFLGGNGVPTNAALSGVYENASATNPVEKFITPTVDVAIKDITIVAPDKNVYLCGSLTQKQFMQGVEMKCGNVNINPDGNNYGLASWQNDYVNITVGKPSDISNFTSNTTYTVSCTVSPKNEGTVSAPGKDAIGNIYVFKPVLTFKDSYVYYGDTAVYGDGNKVSEVWKHGATLSTAVTMIGDAPALDLTYNPESGVENGIVVTTDDILVDVAVKIGSTDVGTYTTFIHQDCTDETWSYYRGKPAFQLHVNTCTLTLSKDGWDSIDDNQSFLFNVKGQGNVPAGTINMTVVVQGNGNIQITGLPVGAYTIAEDTNWSWRYTPVYPEGQNSYTAELTPSADGDHISLIIKNNRTEVKWLDGNAYCSNVFNQTVVNSNN